MNGLANDCRRVCEKKMVKILRVFRVTRVTLMNLQKHILKI